jgi:hypothetical protein
MGLSLEDVSPKKQNNSAMKFDDKADMTQTLMKALSDLKEPNKPSKPRSRVQSNVSSSSNKERKSRIMDRDDMGTQRSERKSSNAAKKEGFRSRITNWWSQGKNNEGKKKDSNQ